MSQCPSVVAAASKSVSIAGTAADDLAEATGKLPLTSHACLSHVCSGARTGCGCAYGAYPLRAPAEK